MDCLRIMKELIVVLFRRHKKHLPYWLEETFIGFFLKYGIMIFLSAWLFQGMLYMDKREIYLKVMLDIGITYLLMTLNLHFVFAFFIAHTINFAFNGQLFTMYTHMGATNVTSDSFIEYVINLQKRLNQYNFISVAAAFGSISKGIYKATSDLDIRICPKKGSINWLKSVLLGFMERARAFVFGFPLDLYIFDIEIVRRKMKTDEPPIVFVDNSKIIDKFYNESISFDEFITIFANKNCG